jgi:LacI family transcriptional regulator
LLYGVHDALAARGIHLTITRLPDEKLTSEGFVPVILRQTATDGLLVNYRTAIPASLVEQIRTHSIPSIWIESAQPADGVDIDHRDSARQLTSHLIELGHRHIAFADHYVDHHLAENAEAALLLHPSIIDRREGYDQTMRGAGLLPRFIHRPQVSHAPDRIELAKQWLSQPDRPTAIVAYVQATAWPIIIAAQGLGLRIPDDLSVTTFSDSPMMGFKLTEMRLPEQEMGHRAVAMLLEKIENPRGALQSVRLKATLQVGATSGPPRT